MSECVCIHMSATVCVCVCVHACRCVHACMCVHASIRFVYLSQINKLLLLTATGCCRIELNATFRQLCKSNSSSPHCIIPLSAFLNLAIQQHIIITKYYYYNILSSPNTITTTYYHHQILSLQHIIITKYYYYNILSSPNTITTTYYHHQILSLSPQNSSDLSKFCQHKLRIFFSKMSPEEHLQFFPHGGQWGGNRLTRSHWGGAVSGRFLHHQSQPCPILYVIVFEQFVVCTKKCVGGDGWGGEVNLNTEPHRN